MSSGLLDLVRLPRPRPDGARVVVEPPGLGRGNWAGAPSAATADDGTVWLAYRLRRPEGTGRGYANVVARSEDGERFETVCVLRREEFSCDSLERPALVVGLDGRWHLYVSCATPGTKHWRVDVMEAAGPDEFRPDSARTVFPGARGLAAKDTVVKVEGGMWHAWVCCHPLDDPDATDRMHTRYAGSDDGVRWRLEERPALSGTAGRWDARGARVAEVARVAGRWSAYYDGRASAEENAEERTGLAGGDVPVALRAEPGVFAEAPEGTRSLRYLSMVPAADGGVRLYYETSRRDGSHDLRTEYVPPTR